MTTPYFYLYGIHDAMTVQTDVRAVFLQRLNSMCRVAQVFDRVSDILCAGDFRAFRAARGLPLTMDAESAATGLV